MHVTVSLRWGRGYLLLFSLKEVGEKSAVVAHVNFVGVNLTQATFKPFPHYKGKKEIPQSAQLAAQNIVRGERIPLDWPHSCLLFLMFSSVCHCLCGWNRVNHAQEEGIGRLQKTQRFAEVQKIVMGRGRDCRKRKTTPKKMPNEHWACSVAVESWDTLVQGKQNKDGKEIKWTILNMNTPHCKLV